MTVSVDTGIEVRSAGARRRRAWFALAVLLAVAGAAGAAYALRSQPGGSGNAPAASSTSHYQSSLGWSIRYPRGMHVEHSAASGISFGVNETTFANFRSRHGVQRRTTPTMETIREVPPRNRLGSFPAQGIAVRVVASYGPPIRIAPGVTRLPLRLSSFRAGGLLRDWYPGTRPRPLQHVLLSKGQRYFIQVWIGPRTSARQRALLTRMIASISVGPPRNRS